MIDIPHRIKRMRAVLGWTQQQVADYLNGKIKDGKISKASISQWERGDHDVPATKYCALVERYEKEIYVKRDDPFFNVTKVKPEPPVVA